MPSMATETIKRSVFDNIRVWLLCHGCQQIMRVLNLVQKHLANTLCPIVFYGPLVFAEYNCTPTTLDFVSRSDGCSQLNKQE